MSLSQKDPSPTQTFSPLRKRTLPIEMLAAQTKMNPPFTFRREFARQNSQPENLLILGRNRPNF
jgi:hypothetical protein